MSPKLQLEYEVFKLAKCFRDEFIKTGDFKIYSLNKVKEGKWWPFFVKTVDNFYNNEGWDASLFVKCLFKKYGKIYPFMLPRNSSWSDYLEYKGRFEYEQSTSDLLSSMVIDFKKMKSIMEEKNIKTYREFFRNRYVKNLIETDTFNSVLFYFMKSFVKEYGEPTDKITIKKLILYRDKKILKKLDQLFSNELYLDDVEKFIKNI